MGEGKPRKVSVVIFNYNGMEFIEKCIKHVLAQGYKDYDLYMLDNGSTDGSDTLVSRKYPDVKIIRIEKNNGIAEAQDLAYRSVKGKYIVSLHNDAFARPGWLAGMVKLMDEADPSVAAIESGIMQADGSLKGMPNIALTNTRIDREDGQIMYAATCAMIMRNGILDKYQDADYHFYYEDMYLGWLLRLMGFKATRTGRYWVDHLGSRSETTMQVKKRNQFFSERNRCLNFISFFGSGTVIKLVPLFVTYTALNFVGILKKSRWKALPWLRAYAWLLTHPIKISEKRAWVQRHRRVPDSEILPVFSYSLPKPMGKMSQIYCRLLKINCYGA